MSEDFLSDLAKDNPFRVPEGDILTIRNQMRRERRKRREEQRKLKLWERVPVNSRRSRLSRRQLLGGVGKSTKPKVTELQRVFRGKQEKENSEEFIAKKREMFLIQMSINTKKAEIAKLEEKADMKEQALQKSEQMLEQDALRFDNFLRENDIKAHEARIKAEEKTKIKLARQARLNELEQAVARLDHEIGRCTVQLANCDQYQRFLDSVTPPDHLARVARKRAEREQRRRQLRETGLGDIYDDSSDDDMYFKEPRQLLDVFTKREERDLFLIENVQESEESLEELKQQFAETAAELDAKTADLEQNIAVLKSKIQAEQAKARTLRRRHTGQDQSQSQQNLLEALTVKIREVYNSCFTDDQQPSGDPLDVLRAIEAWLEFLLTDINAIPDEVIVPVEKRYEDDRRTRARQEKEARDAKKDEDRQIKSTARAEAEVHRRSGKPVMFRSAMNKKRVVKETRSSKEDQEAEELRLFYST